MKTSLKLLYCSILLSSMLFGLAGCKGCSNGSDSSNSSDTSSSIDSGTETPAKFLDNIVENDTAKYSILIPDEQNVCVEYAAEELQNFVEQATGCTMPIVRESSAQTNNKYISLGETTVLEAAGLDVDYDSLNLDGYVMKTDEKNNLIINGYRNSGVLNGVYDFLENVVGVKFLTRDYTYIPTLDKIELYEKDVVSVPAFATRDVFSYSTMVDKEYAARMRLTSKYGATPEKYGENGANAYYAGDGHTLLQEMGALVPYDVYGEAHPDWYYNKGQELRYTNGLTANDEFDASDTDSLIYNLIEICKERILAKPGASYFMLGQPDNGAWDTSPEALLSMERNGGKAGTLMVFMNTIAEQIEKWLEEENIDRDVMFVTFAYWKTIDAPVKLVNGEYVPYNNKVKARDNVAIKVAHMTCSYHSLYDPDCSENALASARLKQWSVITDNIFIWDYITNFTTNFYWFPHYNSIVKNLKFYQEIGVVEVMSQGAPHVGNYYQENLDNYLYSKLMWNPDQDVNALIREFNYYYYGEESSKAMNSFVDLMFYHYGSLGGADSFYHTNLYDSGDFHDFTYYPVGMLENATAILQSEIAAVENREGLTQSEKSELILKIKNALIQPMFMTLYNYDAYYDASTKQEYAEEFFNICEELEYKYYGEGQSIADLKTKYGVK